MASIARLLRLDHFEPDRIVTSNLVRPLTLAILRGLLCLYCLIVIVSVWATSESASGYLMFFTNLTYFGLNAYLVCSTLWSIGYLRQPTPERAQWLKNRSPWWGYAHWLLYSTVVTFHIVVPIVFWTLLSTGAHMSTFGSWQNASVHAVDGVCAVFELIFNRHVLEPVHAFVVTGVMLLYMFLTFVVHKTKGIWVYPFLNWDQGAIAVAYYLGIALGLLIIFFVLLVLHRCRNRWLAGRCERVNHDQQLESLQRQDHQQHQDVEKTGP
ncbi:hypothetical protein BC939DRAFT_229298 [Gamsiella multidivaricata]|uniref:uncharacterized protein n=1 Tax=Gamsiella multidivaricata TaxID=101098 RepID=UPI00222013D9|nr:uncharacterized protein BC939DRAFT_229298 [Gamsiella multidivaricata]KAG0355231.1 hypothetical protein BGZ54_001250 [Gamsiella multidivaricata]KAI7820703.1 hypothetical protein BC939DRAFT_229298 [Gamsiella multidivaricata]